MDYGIAFPSYIDAWRDAAAAEAAGFTHAWFFDSQLIYSDVYATMALAAEHTSTIKLGTPGLHSQQPALRRDRLRDRHDQLSGARSSHPRPRHRLHRTQHDGPPGRAGLRLSRVHPAGTRSVAGRGGANPRGRPRALDSIAPSRSRRLHQHRGRHPHLPRRKRTESARRDRRTRRRLGHRALTPDISSGFETIRGAAAAAGRSTDKRYTVGLTSGCVLRDGEALTSPRVVERVGPTRSPDCTPCGNRTTAPEPTWASPTPTPQPPSTATSSSTATPAAASRIDVTWTSTPDTGLPQTREEQFISETSIGATLTGTPAQIIERLEQMQAAGIDNVAIACTNAAGARDLIEDFGNEVIAKRSVRRSCLDQESPHGETTRD